MEIVYKRDIDPFKMIVNLDSNGNIISLKIPRPSNFHSHLRFEDMMNAVARQIMVWVKYLLIMPNTGPIDTIDKMLKYWNQLLELSDQYGFEVEFIMTIYFTDQLTPQIIERLTELPFKCAVKYYPPHQGATTGSGAGIPLKDAPETLQAMSDYFVPLLIHGESVYDKYNRELPHAEREGYFVKNEYYLFRDTYPDMFNCFEHASTELAVKAIESDKSGKSVLTCTPHHLLFNIEEVMGLSYKNHLKIMPIEKTIRDQRVLNKFVTSGDPRAILGDDTAPHPSSAKVGTFEEAACGAWLPHSLSLYVLAFKRANALDERFVKFACLNGPDWWNLPRPDINDTVHIVRETEHDIPDPTPILGGPHEGDVIIPLGWTEENDRLKIGHVFSESN